MNRRETEPAEIPSLSPLMGFGVLLVLSFGIAIPLSSTAQFDLYLEANLIIFAALLCLIIAGSAPQAKLKKFATTALFVGAFTLSIYWGDRPESFAGLGYGAAGVLVLLAFLYNGLSNEHKPNAGARIGLFSLALFLLAFRIAGVIAWNDPEISFLFSTHELSAAVLIWVGFRHRPKLIEWGTLLVVGGTVLVLVQQSNWVEIFFFEFEHQLGDVEIDVEASGQRGFLIEWSFACLAGLAASLLIRRANSTNAPHELEQIGVFALIILGAGLGEIARPIQEIILEWQYDTFFSSQSAQTFDGLINLALGAGQAQAVELPELRKSVQDTIVITASRVWVNSALLVGNAALLWIGSLYLGSVFRRGWPFAMIIGIGAISLLEAVSAIWAGDYWILNPLNWVGMSMLAALGASKSKSSVTLGHNLSSIDLHSTFAVRKSSLASNWALYPAGVFETLQKSVKQSAGAIEKLLSSGDFQPLRFKVNEARRAARPALILVFILTVLVHVYVAVRDGVPAAMGVGFILTQLFVLIQNAINAYAIPIVFLVFGAFTAAPLLPHGAQSARGRSIARWLYFIHDGANGLRAQMLASVSYIIVINGIMFSQSSIDMEASFGRILLLPGIIVFGISAIWLMFINIYRVPHETMKMLGHTKSSTKLASGMLHLFAGLLVSLVLGLVLVFVGYGFDLAEAWSRQAIANTFGI
jgi:hypothetical protein